jgi:hypothetical protein
MKENAGKITFIKIGFAVKCEPVIVQFEKKKTFGVTYKKFGDPRA